MIIEVNIAQQNLVIHNEKDQVCFECAISSGKAGTGFEEGSRKTPVGRFRIAQKIGDGYSLSAIFRARMYEGEWDGISSQESDLILTRILWLDGLEEKNANTYSRYIYIHGTNHEDRLGSPVSHGCIRLSRADMLRVYEQVFEGDIVVIKEV